MLRFAAIAIAFTSALTAQLTTGDISGDVVDTQGLAMSNAQVLVLNELTGQRFET